MIKFTVITNTANSSLKRIQDELDKLPPKVYKEFVQNTPIRSGNARRKTKLNKDEIIADYPYAKRLDEGYSKQAPKGMTVPTEKYMRKELNRIMRK